MTDDRRLREIFHFCFLERLLKLSDAELYVLKGGVNLRFFFQSPRYSEDMDLDVTAGSVATLKKNGYKIIGDAAFARILRTFGIEAVEVNDPAKAKHTQTTQRFRVGLVTRSGERLPTKIEFSRREGAGEGAVTGMIDPELARHYKRVAFRCRHYPGDIAAVQKVEALAGRPVAQARDVFDLAILHAGGFIRAGFADGALSRKIRENAAANLMSLSYEQYQGQVLEFLDPEARGEYASKAVWNDMQATILELLTDER